MGYFQVRYDSRVINYDRRGFIRLATDWRAICNLYSTHSFWEDEGGHFEERMIGRRRVRQLVDLGAESKLLSGFAPPALSQAFLPAFVATKIQICFNMWLMLKHFFDREEISISSKLRIWKKNILLMPKTKCENAKAIQFVSKYTPKLLIVSKMAVGCSS